MIDVNVNGILWPRGRAVWLVRTIGVVLAASMAVLALGSGAAAPANRDAAAPTANPGQAPSADQDTAGAPIADVSGPGQAVPQPASQCPRTVGCQYAEQNFLPNGYRLQSLQICGANCTTQYWVSAMSDGHQLLEIEPVRGGAILAVSRETIPSDHPSVRVVIATYTATDPACCPSSYSDTTYSWDAGSNSLVPGEPAVTPADQFPGYEATRQQLSSEGWIVASV